MRLRTEAEPLSEDLFAQYKEALKREGFNHLTPLLNTTNETVLFGTLKAFAQDPQSPSADFETICQRYQIRPRIIPPERLLGVCGERGGKIVPTSLGHGLARLAETCPLSLFLTDGSAMEILEVKPPVKRRELPISAKSFSPEAVRLGLIFPTSLRGASPPPIDLDLLMVTPDSTLSLKEINEELAKGPLRRGVGTRIYVKQSEHRLGFKRVEIATSRYYELSNGEPDEPRRYQLLAERFSFGHLFFPEDSRTRYGPENRLLVHLMSRSIFGSAAILLVPIRKNGKLISFRGMEVNFFNYQQWLRAINISGRAFSLSTYHFPEFAFPKENPSEMLAHFQHEFNTWGWVNALPLVELNPQGETVYHLENAVSDPKALRELSQRTAAWFAENIVYPIAANPDLLGDEKARRIHTKKTLEALKGAIDGDPFLATIRCLSPEKRTPGSPAFGMGIFDEKGLFPNLGVFLNEKNKWRLLVLKMKTCPYGPAGMGWHFFVDFLFEETGNDALKVARLLTPTIYPGTWEKFLKEFLADFDPRRLKEAVELPRATTKDRIFAVLYKAHQPLTTQQVAELASISQATAYQALVGLAEKEKIVQLGGKRSRKAEGKIGSGGQRASWATPEIAEAFPVPTPQDLTAQAVIEGARSLQAICDVTGLKRPTLELVLKRLEELELVTISKRKREGPRGSRLLISPTKKLLEIEVRPYFG